MTLSMSMPIRRCREQFPNLACSMSPTDPRSSRNTHTPTCLRTSRRLPPTNPLACREHTRGMPWDIVRWWRHFTAARWECDAYYLARYLREKSPDYAIVRHDLSILTQKCQCIYIPMNQLNLQSQRLLLWSSVNPHHKTRWMTGPWRTPAKTSTATWILWYSQTVVSWLSYGRFV